MSSGGLVYHVVNRGVRRQRVFDDDGDYAAFLRALAETYERFPTVAVVTFCGFRLPTPFSLEREAPPPLVRCFDACAGRQGLPSGPQTTRGAAAARAVAATAVAFRPSGRRRHPEA